MSAHTPGPWIVERDMKTCVIRGAEEQHTSTNEPIVNFKSRGYVASTWGGEHTANARLIAAAPELLDALFEAERAMALTSHPNCGKNEGDPLFVARAAIAKATGGAL